MLLAYPVCMYKQDVGYTVIVPDFDHNATQGDDLKEAIYMAEDLIAGLIASAIEDGHAIPKASEPTNALLEPEEYGEGFVSIVLVDLAKKEKEFAELNKLVKKTLTIPNWVNKKATELNINFSQTLTEALIEKIN